jgi:hypothetical protein
MTRFQDAEQHWTMMAAVPAAIAAGRYGDEAWERAKAFRTVGIVGVVLTAVGFVLVVFHARSPELLRLIPADHYDAHADIVNELAGWDRVRARVTEASNQASGNVVLASNHYSLCGRLMFETGDAPPVYCPTARRSAFDFFGRKDPPADATVVLLTTDVHDELPVGIEGRTCSVSDQVDIERGGRHVGRYLVQTCPPVRTHEQDQASR